MTDLEALRRAIILHPSEDVPRLIFADALDESGVKGNVAWARWIRLMTEWERKYGEEWANAARGEKGFGKFKKGFSTNYTNYFRCPVKRERHDNRPPGMPPIERMKRSFNSNTFTLNVFDNPQVHISGPWECRWQFRRGFITRVKCHYPHWVLYGADLTENEPIEEVEFTSPVLDLGGTGRVNTPTAADILRFVYPRVSKWMFSNG